MKKAKVLLIRTEQDCIQTAEKLKDSGFDPISAPLQKMILHPQNHSWPKRRNTPQNLIITSKNSVYAIYHNLNQISNNKEWYLYVVGEKTAVIANKFINNCTIKKISPNIVELIQYMTKHSPKSELYHYFRGKNQKVDLVATTHNLGFTKISETVVYSDKPVKDNHKIIRQFFAESMGFRQKKTDLNKKSKQDQNFYIMLYSCGSTTKLLEILSDIYRDCGVNANSTNRCETKNSTQNLPHYTNVIAICISNDVALCCLKTPKLFVKTIVAPEPTENSMIQAMLKNEK